MYQSQNLQSCIPKMGLAVDEIYCRPCGIDSGIADRTSIFIFCQRVRSMHLSMRLNTYVSPKATLYTQMFSMKAMEMIMEGFRKT